MEDHKTPTKKKARAKFLNNKTYLGIIMVFLLAIICVGVVVIINNQQKSSAKNLEKEMSSLTSQYFDEFIRSKVIGINKQIITIETLEKANYDTSKLTDPYTGKACDKQNSYSYIIINDPAETAYDKITYTVENHLVCEQYNSDEKNN